MKYEPQAMPLIVLLCGVPLAAAPVFAQGGSPASADISKLASGTSKESQACIACHESGTAPLAVQQWALSRHAQVGIGCYECHQAEEKRPDAFDHFGYSISVLVTPKSCGTCHVPRFTMRANTA